VSNTRSVFSSALISDISSEPRRRTSAHQCSFEHPHIAPPPFRNPAIARHSAGTATSPSDGDPTAILAKWRDWRWAQEPDEVLIAYCGDGGVDDCAGRTRWRQSRECFGGLDADCCIGWDIPTSWSVFPSTLVRTMLMLMNLVTALLHIVLHAFRRPLTILVPPSPLTNTSPTNHSPPIAMPTNRSNHSLAPNDRPSARSNIQRSYSSSDSDDADVTTPLTRAPGMGASVQAHPFSRPRDAPSGTPRERSFKNAHLPSSSSNTHLPNEFTPPSTSTSFPPSVPPMPPSDPTIETLLQRKERALQRRRLGRRIFWDVGVWLGLSPVSVGGIVWMVGRLVGRW
jgi:hypothetical protein